MNENTTAEAYRSPAESPQPSKSIPIWFWIVGVVVLLWNLMGLMAFVAQMMMTESAPVSYTHLTLPTTPYV